MLVSDRLPAKMPSKPFRRRRSLFRRRPYRWRSASDFLLLLQTEQPIQQTLRTVPLQSPAAPVFLEGRRLRRS
jgi:hypothetical protein